MYIDGKGTDGGNARAGSPTTDHLLAQEFVSTQSRELTLGGWGGTDFSISSLIEVLGVITPGAARTILPVNAASAAGAGGAA